MRRNLLPGLVLQTCALFVVLAYAFLPSLWLLLFGQFHGRFRGCDSLPGTGRHATGAQRQGIDRTSILCALLDMEGRRS